MTVSFCRRPSLSRVLEALFVSDTKTWRVTERLCKRISFFLAHNAEVQAKLFAQANDCYDTRSRITHGWKVGVDKFNREMGDTEAIARTVMRHILEKPGMLKIFTSDRRDEFLEAWVQSGKFELPTLV